MNREKSPGSVNARANAAARSLRTDATQTYQCVDQRRSRDHPQQPIEAALNFTDIVRKSLNHLPCDDLIGRERSHINTRRSLSGPVSQPFCFILHEIVVDHSWYI